MTAALSGPSAYLGQEVRAGVLAAFEEVNRAGGVKGRSLKLIALDDGYEPSRTAPLLRSLTARSDLIGFIGCTGAPCAVAAVPIANESRTPLVGYVTGGAALRKKPPDPYVVNLRPGLAEEAAFMVDGFVSQGIPPESIAFFTQRDAYGDSAFAGGVAALSRHGLAEAADAPHARYERNTTAVQNALSELLLAPRPVQAIILAAANAPAAEFVREVRRIGLPVQMATFSFVGATKLASELGAVGDGVVVTQVVPHPASDLPIARRYREAMLRRDPSANFSFLSLEGYAAARMLFMAMERMQAEPTRESLIEALLGLGRFDLGMGEPLFLDPNEHQATHRLWPTVLRNGQVVEFNWRELRKPQ